MRTDRTVGILRFGTTTTWTIYTMGICTTRIQGT
jgi:hypothetical protein